MRAWVVALLSAAALAAALHTLAIWIEDLDTEEPTVSGLPDLAVPEDEDLPPTGELADLGPVVINPAWIGGPCLIDDECPYEGGYCLLPVQGYPEGYCTRACTGSCPDRRGDLYSDTFCVSDPQRDGEGICMARCAMHLTASGCRDGYVCSTASRLRTPATERMVCIPDLGSPPPETECTGLLRTMKLDFGRPDMADAETLLGESRRTCQIDTPVLLASPLHGVDYRETGRRLAEHVLVSCTMAVAVERMSRVLSELEIVEVEHVGTYNCRGVARSTRLSAHAEGRALDVKAFERANGPPVNVQRDWNGRNRERREFLRSIVRRLKNSGIFTVILTPDSNAQHHDHFHLEIPR